MGDGKNKPVAGWAFRVALLLVLGGCNITCDVGTAVSVGLLRGLAHLPAKPAVGNRYVKVRAKRDGIGGNFRPNREVWKPFRFEASLGLPDPDHADLGPDGSFGVSVLRISGDGYVGVTAKRSGDGVQIDALNELAQSIGTLTIPDTIFADVAIESSGNTAVVTARKRGGAAYLPVATTALVPAGPYVLSLDFDDLAKGAVVGYDDFRLPSNGAPPAPTAAQSARETIYTAIDALAEAMYALDGDVPDRPAAGDQAALAVTRLDTALALDLSAFAGTSKKLRSARKQANALVPKVRGTKSVNSLHSSLRAIVTLAGRGADAVK